MNTKKNFIVLLLIVILAAVLYQGVIGLFGFTKTWGHWRQIAFILLNIFLFYIPAAALLFFYQRKLANKIGV